MPSPKKATEKELNGEIIHEVERRWTKGSAEYCKRSELQKRDDGTRIDYEDNNQQQKTKEKC